MCPWRPLCLVILLSVLHGMATAGSGCCSSITSCSSSDCSANVAAPTYGAAMSFQYCSGSCGSWVEREESCSGCSACSACGGDARLVKECEDKVVYSPTYRVSPLCEATALLEYLSALKGLNASQQRTSESLCLRPELNVSSEGAVDDLVVFMDGWYVAPLLVVTPVLHVRLGLSKLTSVEQPGPQIFPQHKNRVTRGMPKYIGCLLFWQQQQLWVWRTTQHVWVWRAVWRQRLCMRKTMWRQQLWMRV
jgi:hypothetical protein